jgi:hypothetical protein
VRYFRTFRLTADGALASPYNWGPIIVAADDPAVLEARCPLGHTPPAPACLCGVYAVAGWRQRLGIPLLCMVGPPPRVLAEVDLAGQQPLPDPSPRALVGVVRVGWLRVLSLWLPAPGHCWGCRFGRPPQPDLDDATLERLQARYQVPAARW